jgi:hypothetical protein
MRNPCPLPRCPHAAVAWYQTDRVRWYWCAAHLPTYCDTFPLDDDVEVTCDYRFVVVRITPPLEVIPS